jgi:ribosomal-protein-alanine N-acetyltransferase
MDRIDTDRLLLRRFTLEDLPAYTEIRRQPAFCRYLLGGAAGAKNAEKRAREVIKQCLRHYDDAPIGVYAVIDKASGQLIGHGGLRYVEEIAADELLYGLTPAVWGQGLATELCQAVLDARQQDPKAAAVTKAIVIPENLASVRVLEKAGFIFEKEIDYLGIRHVALFSLAR